jgi:endonuclease/exonuclease/phosphatase (EEP) superfamily protein YafD
MAQGTSALRHGKVSELVILVRLVAIAALLALGGGALGALHPAGDSLAVFRVPLTGLLLVTGWALRPRVLAWGAMLLAFVGLAWHGGQLYRPDRIPDRAPDLTLYQQNLLMDRQSSSGFVSAISDASADVLTLQEVSAANLSILETLRGDYPHQIHCPLEDWLGEAVLSRHPFVPGSAFCSRRDGLAGAQIMMPDGPVWVVSLHISWPWPHGQAVQLDELLPELKHMSGPVVVAGDFNAVSWSYAVKRVGDAVSAKRIGRRFASFNLPIGGMPIGIDHVLSNGFGVAKQQAKLGSDHHGAYAKIWFY